jgi:transcriptional regulator GlxA family with amidase domain
MDNPRQLRPKRIGFLLFDDITALDVVGPMEAFALARVPQMSTPCYESITIGVTKKEVVAESGIILKCRVPLAQCPKLDTLIIPGGRGLRVAATNKTIADWIRGRANITRREFMGLRRPDFSMARR